MGHVMLGHMLNHLDPLNPYDDSKDSTDSLQDEVLYQRVDISFVDRSLVLNSNSIFIPY
jgi:hypothetical protein